MTQRRRTRVESRKAATVRSLSGECRGEIVNISLKGCLVELAEGRSPSRGETVSVIIHLDPGNDQLDIELRGQIAREDPRGPAVDFLEVPPESFPHLFRLVQYNAPDPESIEQELSSWAFDADPKPRA
ncbi:MAG: hypothetical protein Kow0092_17370 [Deferrisomatales bacterium]